MLALIPQYVLVDEECSQVKQLAPRETESDEGDRGIDSKKFRDFIMLPMKLSKPSMLPELVKSQPLLAIFPQQAIKEFYKVF